MPHNRNSMWRMTQLNCLRETPGEVQGTDARVLAWSRPEGGYVRAFSVSSDGKLAITASATSSKNDFGVAVPACSLA